MAECAGACAESESSRRASGSCSTVRALGWLLAVVPLTVAPAGGAQTHGARATPPAARATPDNSTPANSTSAGAASQAPEHAAVESAARWIAAARRTRKSLDEARLAELAPILAELRIALASRPETRPAIARVLLEIASLAPRARDSWGADPRAGSVWTSTPAERASAQAFEALARGLDLDERGEFAAAVSEESSGADPSRPLERRRAALESLRGRRIEATLPALVAATEDPQRVLRDAATAALEGWEHPEAHRAMLAQWVRIRTDLSRTNARHVERHFAAVRLPPGSALEVALLEALRGDLLGRDWRATLRALRVSQALGDATAVPVLIEALALCGARRRSAEAGGATTGGRSALPPVTARMENEIVLDLQRRSGKRIGAYPERWARWWRTAQDAPASPLEAQQQATRAGFYGLRPVTDRVCFVIDRSGSMSAGHGADSTRYHQALAELERFLRGLGPGARFRIVLFSSDLAVWKDTLTPASPASINEALNWAGYHKPDGGTALRPAIEHVLRLGRDGTPDLTRLEEDTVIVLCDGATNEGPLWVEPLLERVGAATCVAFQCVQIGRGGGDGALRRLAASSGGEYVETDG